MSPNKILVLIKFGLSKNFGSDKKGVQKHLASKQFHFLFELEFDCEIRDIFVSISVLPRIIVEYKLEEGLYGFHPAY